MSSEWCDWCGDDGTVIGGKWLRGSWIGGIVVETVNRGGGGGGVKQENESCSIKSFQLTGNVYFLI